MGKMDDEILLDAPLTEEADSSIADQPEEESLFDILGLEEKHSNNIENMKFLARQGEEIAIYALGTYYMNGTGVEQDFAEACYWFEKSHDAASKMHIAYAYEQEGNKELATEYYRQGAEAEEDRHSVRGLCYYSLAGNLLKSDVDEAEVCFLKMLECKMSQGLRAEIPDFAYMLGLNYLIAENHDKAVRWFRFCLRYDRNNSEAKNALEAALAQAVSMEQRERIGEISKAKTVEPVQPEQDQNRSTDDSAETLQKRGFFATLFGRKKR